MLDKVRIEATPTNAWCQILRARLSEFQGLLKLGNKQQALETLADIEDVLSTLAVLVDSKEL